MGERIVHVWRSRDRNSTATRCGLDPAMWRWRDLIGRIVYKTGAEPKKGGRWCSRCVPAPTPAEGEAAASKDQESLGGLQTPGGVDLGEREKALP